MEALWLSPPRERDFNRSTVAVARSEGMPAPRNERLGKARRPAHLSALPTNSPPSLTIATGRRRTILTASEQIDQAVTNLVGLLTGNFERGLTQDIRDRVTQIFEACNFQDLTDQRIAKVRASFERLDRAIAGTIDELAGTGIVAPTHGPRLADDASMCRRARSIHCLTAIPAQRADPRRVPDVPYCCLADVFREVPSAPQRT